MSFSTIFGIFVSIGILAFAIASQTVTTAAFINLPGIAIVLGGTAAAVLVSYSVKDVLRVLYIFWLVIKKQKIQVDAYVRQLTGIASRSRLQGILSLQKEIPYIKDPFLKDGLQMLVDGYTSQELSVILHKRIVNRELQENSEAKVFRTMAKFAPAFGMLGTVIGLIAMLQKMSGSSIETIGPSMAVALVTTFYGLILSNMLFTPIAEKLERRKEERIQLMNLILEGLTLIGEQWHPDKVQDMLNAYLLPGTRKTPPRKWENAFG